MVPVVRASGKSALRKRVAAFVVFAAVLLAATAALADVSGSDGSGTITVTVGGTSQTPGSNGSGPSGGGSSSGSACTWTELSTGAVPGLAAGGPTPGNWWIESCPVAGGGLATTVLWITSLASAPPASGTSPSLIAQQAEKSIPLPLPGLEFNPSDYSVTNLATWLWIDPAMWHAYSASASAAGITATVTAAPVSVTWTMGDGSSGVVCAGPGVPYDQSIPSDQQSTYCSYVYRRSSAGEPTSGGPNSASFPVAAIVTWQVSWTSSVGVSGVLPPLYTSATAARRVEQIESIQSNS